MTQINELNECVSMLNSWASNGGQTKVFNDLVLAGLAAFKNGNRIFFAGNGGSASEASHLAAEFVGKCVIDTGALPAISLSESSTIITAISNDWAFDTIFERQLKALGNEGDIFIGLSTSGESPSILRGLLQAKEMGLITSLWTSQRVPRKVIESVDFPIIAPTTSTPRAQELHLLLGHSMAENIENQLSK